MTDPTPTPAAPLVAAAPEKPALLSAERVAWCRTTFAATLAALMEADGPTALAMQFDEAQFGLLAHAAALTTQLAEAQAACTEADRLREIHQKYAAEQASAYFQIAHEAANLEQVNHQLATRLKEEEATAAALKSKLAERDNPQDLSTAPGEIYLVGSPMFGCDTWQWVERAEYQNGQLAPDIKRAVAEGQSTDPVRYVRHDLAAGPCGTCRKEGCDE